MSELKTAITVVEIIVGVAVCMVLGDYLGYKFGRMKIAGYMLIFALAAIIVFAIYAAVRLNQ